MEEVQQSIADGAKGKCPGPDGLPLELYSAVWSVIKGDFLSVVTTVLDRRRTCESQKAGVLVLVPKVPNARTGQQYRPLTMLNSDYKIIVQILNTKIVKHMPTLLNPSQVGPGSERGITGSLVEIREAVAHHDATQQPAALVSLDLQWAFDLVNHDFLFAVLRGLGFGATFTSWLQCLCAGCSSWVEVNGYLLAPFAIGRSVRQGGPESMTLFILVIRPFVARLHSVLRSTLIRGIHFVLANYVDDTQILLTGPDQIPALKNTVGEFQGTSGLRVNYAKSMALTLGGWDPEAAVLPFGVVANTRILGIVFSPHVDQLPAPTSETNGKWFPFFSDSNSQLKLFSLTYACIGACWTGLLMMLTVKY